MEQPRPAKLRVAWQSGPAQEISLQYNPGEFSLDKGVQLAEIAIPGLDTPLQQFVRGQAERLTVELFFDTTDQGMGTGATSVTTLTDQIYQLVKIEPGRHAPPICTFTWNNQFPGSALSPALGNQSRNSFQCVVESVKQKFTLFSPEGIPLRAMLTVALREYKPLEQQLQELNLNSPDRTHTHVLQRGESLASVAARYYRRAGEWRRIAEANGIEDPRRIAPGLVLSVPAIGVEAAP